MTESPFPQSDDPHTENPVAGTEDQCDDDELASSRQTVAAARRFKILQVLAEKGPSTIDQIKFRLPQRFQEFQRAVFEQDLREIHDAIGGKTLCKDNNASYELRSADGPDLESTDDSDASRKREIGEFIVDKVLRDAEVVYLSTGTTVQACTHSLVRSIESGENTSIRIILTDNLLVIDLFLNRTRQNDRLANIDFYVLGGKSLWGQSDIGLEGNLAQLSQWGYSAAVVSATAVHPKTGNVYSYRQQETKLYLLKNVAVGTVVIPVTPGKVDNKKVAGKLVLEPRAMRDDVRYMIVSSGLSEEIVSQLQSHGYDVFDAAKHRSSRHTDNEDQA